MALRIRYQRAIARAVNAIIRDQQDVPEFNAWWSHLAPEEQARLIDRWQQIVARLLEYPDESQP